MNNYAEDTFNAISLIVDDKISKVSYDKTIICEVVTADPDNNEYWVQSESVRMKAQSADPSKKYAVKNKVYVLIPGGDYEQTKLITGGYSVEETKKIVNIEKNNYVLDYIGAKYSSSNGEPWDPARSKQVVFKDNKLTTLPYTQDYKYIGVEFSLNSFALFNNDVVQGTYSIILNFIDDDKNSVGTLEIKSTEFQTGNPYALIEEFKQFKLFEYKDDFAKKAKCLEIYLSHDASFKDTSNQDCKELIKEIKLYNLTVSFGHDINDFEDKVEIILPDGESLEYDKNITAANGIRHTYVRWQTKDENGKPIIYNNTSEFEAGPKYEGNIPIYNGDLDDEEQQLLPFVVYRLMYDNESKDGNKPTGLKGAESTYNWRCLTPQEDDKNYVNNYQLFKVLDHTLSKDEQYRQYKVIIRKNVIDKDEEGKYYCKSHSFEYSNILTFVNKDYVEIDEAPAVVLKEEQYNAQYNFYGADGGLIDFKYQGPYTIKASFYDDLPIENLEYIKWIKPENNTMIDWLGAPEGQETFEAQFKIKNKYSPSISNNTIGCVVVTKQGQMRTGQIKCEFGEYNQSSNYSFNIDFVGDPFITTEKEDISKDFVVKFTDSNGNKITPDSYTVRINIESKNFFDLYAEGNQYNWIDITQKDEKFTVYRKKTLSEAQNNTDYLYCYVSSLKINGQFIDNINNCVIPLPLVDKRYKGISGVTRLIYKDKKLQSYSNEKYQLYKKNIDKENSLEAETDVTWKIEPSNPKVAGKLFPTLTFINGEYKLKPQERPPYSAGCKGSINAYKDNICVWSQGIEMVVLSSTEVEEKYTDIIYFNQDNTTQTEQPQTYSLRTSTISEPNGSIVKPHFIAGNQENTTADTFTGVTVGKLENEGGSKSQEGIYAFKNGYPVFKLTDDGNVYIKSQQFGLTEEGNVSIEVLNEEEKVVFSLNSENGLNIPIIQELQQRIEELETLIKTPEETPPEEELPEEESQE